MCTCLESKTCDNPRFIQLGGKLKKSKLVAILAATSVASALALSGCSSSDSTDSASATKTKACLALDTGGVDDKSFNAASWAGAEASAAADSNVEVSYLPAASGAEYAPNIKKFVDQECNLIIGVGFAIAGAIIASAKENPTINYAVVDDAGLEPNADFTEFTAIPNVKGLTFKTQESSFLAGYAAAAYSKKGIVATYGGAPYPTVTAFMDGFTQGVNYFNTTNNKSVRVLGWDRTSKNGEFVGDFANTSKALQISKNFEQAGADVIFPVAGGLGGSTAQNSMDGGKSVTIWVDTDGVESAAKYRSVLLTSVMKGLGESVQAVITEVVAGSFTNEAYVGTLANKGTRLAPFHDFADKIPATLEAELAEVEQKIVSGEIVVE
jgi:basic membrane protein A